MISGFHHYIIDHFQNQEEKVDLDYHLQIEDQRKKADVNQNSIRSIEN